MPTRPITRRAMTLLEVVFAVVLLAMVSVAAMSTVSLILALGRDDDKRLGAHEIANKLILQYLDDKKQLPSTALPIDYAGGRFTYRYKLEETPMEMRTKAREVRSGGGADMRSDRFKLVTIRVYEGLDTGSMIVPGDELAVMSRMLDPAAITRNPDSMRRMLNSPEGIRDLLSSFTGGGAGNQTPAQGAPIPKGRHSRSSGGTSRSGSGSSMSSGGSR